MTDRTSRREFLRTMGLGAAAFPFVCNLPSLGFETAHHRKQRLVVIFSPNGIIPDAFWPSKDAEELVFPPILKPLEPFRERTLVLRGVSDKVRGAGSAHMRGIGCLLTGVELLPGNLKGGSGPPAGWASGISIDQEIKNFLQRDSATRTRFGSLEFGVMVPDRADVWTRLSYSAANRPIAPIDDPDQMFAKLYGEMKDRESLTSILDDVQDDLKKLTSLLGAEDRRLLEEHATFVREMEQELKSSHRASVNANVPDLELAVGVDDVPQRSRMQIDLMANAFASDFARIATLQYSSATSQAQFKWLGIEEKHHELSHEPDSNESAQEKLIRINTWYCEQIAYLAKRLAETPEPGGEGSLLDNTLVVWTNELGKGNSHTMDNIPFVLVGNGLGFKMGRMVDLKKVPHNRLHLALAHGFGHYIEEFGAPDFCDDGPLTGLS